MARPGRGRRQPCAPCKHTGRRCGRSCRLAPYFPSSRLEEYGTAHNMFGLANIQKLLNAVAPSEKMAVAESILSQGRAWTTDPVHGSLGIVRRLLGEIDSCERELAAVNQHLDFYRQLTDGKSDPSSAEGSSDLTRQIGAYQLPDRVKWPIHIVILTAHLYVQSFWSVDRLVIYGFH